MITCLLSEGCGLPGQLVWLKKANSHVYGGQCHQNVPVLTRSVACTKAMVMVQHANLYRQVHEACRLSSRQNGTSRG